MRQLMSTEYNEFLLYRTVTVPITMTVSYRISSFNNVYYNFSSYMNFTEWQFTMHNS